MDVKLNFINQSNDANNSEIVIFQKNVADGAQDLAVAWQVIKYCGQGDNHPFVLPMVQAVGASGSWGNQTERLSAPPGQMFQMVLTASGEELHVNGSASSPQQTQVGNALIEGSITASIYKDDKLLATKTGIAPGQKAVFEFKPTIWIGVASSVVQGQVMNSAIISSINTELSLLGVASADIVMTGGGPGISSTPYQFTLENVVMA